MGLRGGIWTTVVLVAFLLAACGGQDAPAPSEPASAPPRAAPTPPPAQPPKAVAPSPNADLIEKISDIPAEVEDSAQAVSQLQTHLGNEDRDVREAVILALWDIETEEANGALAKVARTEADPELKSYAIEELIDREAPEALGALLEVLNDEDTDLREQAAEGLETLENPGAIQELYARLDKEEDEWVRDAIISALSTVDPDFDEDKYDE